MQRGIIKAYREHLNALAKDSPLHKHGPYHQRTRAYGDYLYSQDREMFMASMNEEIANGTFQPQVTPLPRCMHGNRLRDWGGNALAPSCGCKSN